MIATEGYRAGAVDVGWLQRCVARYARRVTAAELVAAIGRELPTVVQRLKGWAVEVGEWPEVVTLRLETKDDGGSYEYSMTIHVE